MVLFAGQMLILAAISAVAWNTGDPNTKRLIIVGFLLSIIVGYGFSSYVSKQIAFATSELDTCITQLGAGNLTRRSRLSGHDELGNIGHALNKVLDRLQADIRSIAEASDRAASGAMELSATTEEVRSSIERISRAAEKQRQEAESSSTAMEEMAASITSVQQNTQRVEQLAKASHTAADQSRLDVDACTQAMSQIQESSEKVARITTVIAEIARQTNLLSLNAAIEAAKAGAMGKVVAEEVRKLAERSGQAAREITALIAESSERVQAGATSVAAVEKGLGSIATNIIQTTSNLQDIARAMDEQARTGNELARSVSSSSEMADRNATASHQIETTVSETAHTTEDLAKLAQELQNMVMRFKLS